MKIQNVLAEQVGFLQIIFMILFLISSPFIKKKRILRNPQKYLEMLKGWLVREPALEVKKTQRKIGVSSIFSQLDIKCILNKFAEIDKIKMLLLNEDQYQQFEYLPKPVIMKNTKINLNQIEKIEKKSPLKINVFIHQIDLISKAKTSTKSFR